MSIYTILPLISGLFVLGLGILVFWRNRKLRLNQIFFLFTFCVTIWLLGTFMMFTSKEDAWRIFWDRFVYIGVVFIPAVVYHFGLIFSKIKTQKKLLYLGYFLSFIFLFLSRTNYFVEDLYKYSWGYHTQARFLHHIFLVFFTFYIFLFFYNLLQYQRRVKGIERVQAKYTFFAFLILASGSLAFLPAYGISILPFAYLSGVACAIVLAYAILKHHLMNIRVIATEFFVGLIAFVLLLEVLLSKSFSEVIFRLGIFIAFCFLGWLLIKSVLNEIKRRVELEKLTTELKRAYRKLKELDKAKSEFISIASHQLRTPLTAIKGYISMMLEKTYGKPSEKMKKPLENIYASNERLIKLVNDILNVSRIEAGRIEMKLEKLALEDIITSVVGELKNAAIKKNIYLNWERPKKPLPKILVDKDKIRQVLLNVVDNGIRYTEKGGVEIKLKAENEKLKIIVSDTGVGMTRYELLKMFESFSRGMAGTRLYTEGVGLGLYVARRFIEMHHGKIWAESKGKGKGSTFYIELPIK